MTVDPIRLPATVQAAAAARRHVRAAGASWPAQVRDVAELLTSELVANAVVHGAAPVTLDVHDGPTQLRVEVTDADPRLAPRPAIAGSMVAESGRGLQIVQALATAWGSQPQAGGPGKTTWFELQHNGVAGSSPT